MGSTASVLDLSNSRTAGGLASISERFHTNRLSNHPHIWWFNTFVINENKTRPRENIGRRKTLIPRVQSAHREASERRLDLRRGPCLLFLSGISQQACRLQFWALTEDRGDTSSEIAPAIRPGFPYIFPDQQLAS